MTDYEPRSAWGARPPRGSWKLDPDRVEGVALHWPGMKLPIGNYAGVAAALRGWQNYHMDDRGWSDIAYQVAVDQAGRAWTLRGLQARSGANGDADVNTRYGAILLILAPGEEPSEQLLATTRHVVADFRVLYPGGTRNRPHSAIRPDGTECPGDRARAAIARGDFEPRPPDEEIDMASTAELKTQMDRIEITLGRFIAAEAARYRDLANRTQVGTDEERARYTDYVRRFNEILAELQDDPASPVTS